MANNTVSRISNAFATGGGGVNFEQNIQALFLLSLLVDGFCPVINEPTKRVCFQAKHLGYDVDDLAVFTYRGQSEGMLLCQIKHAITVSASSDSLFQEVISASWSDFNKDGFDRKKDMIVLATARIALQSQNALRYLNAQARAAIDEVEFIERVSQTHFSNKINREVLETIKKCINHANKNIDPTDCELWEFCRSFVLILFDLDYAESVNRTLTAMLIKSNCKVDASLVWSKLVDYSARCNQSAASIDIDNIDSDIKQFFLQKTVFYAPPTPLEIIDTFVPVLSIIGSWKEDNPFDRCIIENISGSTYEEFEMKARSMLSQSSEYLSLSNGIWKVLHKEKLFEQCAALFFDDTIERLFLNAKEIYKQTNKSLKKEDRFFISSSETYENSLEIRSSLSDSMCLIKYAADKLVNCNTNKIDSLIYSLIREIFHDCTWIRWASLKDCIQNLAELGPNAFLQELEWNIIHNPTEILMLFPKQGADIFGQNNISELLWALEVLSWSPDYLVSSVRCLGLLEALPYEKTNWANTPINSIVSILLPWHPQTIANSEKQKNAITGLKRDNPEVFWRTILKLLPDRTTTTTGNPKPRFLQISIPEEIQVLTTDLIAQYKTNMSLAVEFAGSDGDKLSELTEEIRYMDTTILTEFLDHIETIDYSGDEEKAFRVWLSLCEQFSKKELKKAPSIQLSADRIERLIKAIEPRDIRIKYRELYLRKHHRFESENYFEYKERMERSKTEAILEIYKEYSFDDVYAFSIAVNDMYDVGFKLGAVSSSEMMSLIIRTFYEERIERRFFAACLNGYFQNANPKELLSVLNGYDEHFVSDVLSMIPFSAKLLTEIEELLANDVVYWEKATMAYGYRDAESTLLQLVLAKLTECKRYVTAVNTIGNSDFSSSINAGDLCDLLILAGTKESIGEEKIDSYAAQRIIEWLQKCDEIGTEQLSEIEFLYLPILDASSEIEPKALRIRLGNDADYFCNMIELFYKKHSDMDSTKELSKGLSDRLFRILFQFSVVPGMDSDGHFDSEQFKKWFDTVKEWSINNDRYAVTMHTVGSGLSYSNPGGRSLPPEAIISELNKPENDELRRGYRIGMSNQRGVHVIDPQGTPEFELSDRFTEIANQAEAMGYSRYSEVLQALSDQYKMEAMYNIQEHHAEAENK